MLSRVLKRQVRFQQSNPQQIQFSTLVVNCSNVNSIDPLLSTKLLKPFTYVSHLYLNHNRIRTLIGVQQFKNLETFHFNYNWVSSINDLLLIQNRFFLKSIGYIGNPIEGTQNILQVHDTNQIGRRRQKSKLLSYEQKFGLVKTLFPNLKQWNSVNSIIQQSDLYMEIDSQQEKQLKTFIAYSGKQRHVNKNQVQTVCDYKTHQRNGSINTCKIRSEYNNQDTIRQNYQRNLYDRKVRAKTQNQTPFKKIGHQNIESSVMPSDSKGSSNFSSGKKLQSTKRNSNTNGRSRAHKFIQQVKIRPFIGNPSDEYYENDKTFTRSNNRILQLRNQLLETARFSQKGQFSEEEAQKLNQIEFQRQILVDAFYRRSLLQKSFQAIKMVKQQKYFYLNRSDIELKRHAWIKLRINCVVKQQLQLHQDWLLDQ